MLPRAFGGKWRACTLRGEITRSACMKGFCMLLAVSTVHMHIICMYVCIYICMYVCTYVCMYVYILVLPHVITWGKIKIVFFTSQERPPKGLPYVCVCVCVSIMSLYIGTDDLASYIYIYI
jgi:hypothetical protein